MPNVTTHFEFTKSFWTLLTVLVLAAVAFYFRNEIKAFALRVEQRTQEINNA